jgi:xylan 1,4-beta-xylosidase
MFPTTKLLLAVIFTVSIFPAKAQQNQKPATIQVDLSKKTNEPLKPIWAWFGYDEPNYTYMKDGKKLLFS